MTTTRESIEALLSGMVCEGAPADYPYTRKVHCPGCAQREVLAAAVREALGLDRSAIDDVKLSRGERGRRVLARLKEIKP